MAATLIPALKPTLCVIDTGAEDAVLCADPAVMLWLVVLEVAWVEDWVVLVVLEVLDVTWVEDWVELWVCVEDFDELEVRLLVLEAIDVLEMLDEGVLLETEAEDVEGWGGIVLVLSNPNTPIMVCAIPCSIEKVPLPLWQSQVPSSTAGVQHQFPSFPSPHACTEPLFAEIGSSEAIISKDIARAIAFVSALAVIPQRIGASSSDCGSDREVPIDRTQISHNAKIVRKASPAKRTA
jgi:hypothetical protein